MTGIVTGFVNHRNPSYRFKFIPDAWTGSDARMTFLLIGLALAAVILGSAGIYAKQALIDDAKSQTRGYF